MQSQTCIAYNYYHLESLRRFPFKTLRERVGGGEYIDSAMERMENCIELSETGKTFNSFILLSFHLLLCPSLPWWFCCVVRTIILYAVTVMTTVQLKCLQPREPQPAGSERLLLLQFAYSPPLKLDTEQRAGERERRDGGGGMINL